MGLTGLAYLYRNKQITGINGEGGRITDVGKWRIICSKSMRLMAEVYSSGAYRFGVLLRRAQEKGQYRRGREDHRRRLQCHRRRKDCPQRHQNREHRRCRVREVAKHLLRINKAYGGSLFKRGSPIWRPSMTGAGSGTTPVTSER